MADQALNFKISTSAELSSLRETERELVKTYSAAKALNNTPVMEKAGRELAEVQQKLGTFSVGQKIKAEVLEAAHEIPLLGSAMNALNGSLGPISAGIAVLAGGVEAAREAINAFADQETRVTKLNQALANSGQYSEEASAQVQELAEKYKDLTGIDDSKFINVARTLLQFGAKTDNLDQYTEAVTNLAGVMGGDVEAAATLFGKAMQGSTEMLGRYGIHVTEGATQTQKLNEIMQQAAKLGGGQLTAGAETLNRQFGALRLGVEDILKGFGSLIARTGVVQVGLEVLTGGLKLLGEFLPKVVSSSEEFDNKLGQIGASAEEMAKRVDLATKAGEDLAKTKLDAFKAEAEAATALFDNLTKSIHAALKAKLELSGSKLDKALAQIDEDESTGKLSHSAAADARFKAKQQAEKEKTQIELEGIEADKRTEKQKVAHAEDTVKKHETGLAEVNGQLTGAQKTLADSSAQIDQLGPEHEKQKAENEEAIRKAKEAYDAHAGTGNKQVPYATALREAKAKAVTDESKFEDRKKSLGETRDNATADIARLKEESKQLTIELASARAALADAKVESENHVAQLDDQKRGIEENAPIKQETAAIQQKKANREAEAKDAEEQNKKKIEGAEGVAGNVADVAEALRGALGKGAASKDDKAKLDELLKAIQEAAVKNEHGATAGGMGEIAAAMIAFLKSSSSASVAANEQIKELGRAVKEAQTKIAGLTASRP